MEAPVIEDLRRRAGRFGLEIVLVNVWESVDNFTEAARFCDIYQVDGPALVDETGEFAALLGIRGVPTNVLVDVDGTVREVGASTPAQLRAGVSALLGRDDWYGEEEE